MPIHTYIYMCMYIYIHICVLHHTIQITEIYVRKPFSDQFRTNLVLGVPVIYSSEFVVCIGFGATMRFKLHL